MAPLLKFPFRCWAVFLTLLIVLTLAPASTRAGDDDDDEESPVDSRAPAWIVLETDDRVENLFRYMVRVEAGAACPVETGVPLLDDPPPPQGSLACGQITNGDDTPGIWRIDFESTFGAGYRIELIRGSTARPILTNSATGGLAERETGTRRLASTPIVIAPDETIELRATLVTPSDIEDADPLLRPELTFDRAVSDRAHGFGGLLGASILLILFFVAVSRLLHSTPAWHYAIYFSATTLAAAANEGYVAALVPSLSPLTIGALDKLLEAAQIAAHLAFVAAFVEESLSQHWVPRAARRLALIAVAALLVAAVWSFVAGGIDGALRYHDLGFELDPLLEDPFSNLSLLLAALASAAWYMMVLAAAVVLLRRKIDGAFLFALGAAILVLALGGSSISDDLLEALGDDRMWLQYALLTDAVLFAGAMVLQAFGLRDQRDAALRQELAVTREKVALAERLETARHDRDRARDLAEGHRARLALTGHDLRQPLTSLKLAVDVAERHDPGLSETLRTSLDYLSSVLNETLADARPTDIGPGHAPPPDQEEIPLQLVLDNAVRMFGDEARAKGLSLSATSTEIVASSQPVALIRMVSNLVANAIKYTEAGSVTLAVRVDQGRAVIDVADTGPGLTASEIEVVLQTYSRGEGVEAIEGEGLGLSSVQQLALSLGLRLQIEATPGEGSRFSIAGLIIASGRAS